MSDLDNSSSRLSPEQVESLITLNRAHGVFELLRGIAHDLRNNLQVVALGTTDDGSNPRVDRAIDAMIESLDLLGRLGRHPDADPSEAVLGAAVRDAVQLIDYQRNLAPVRVTLELADEKPIVPVSHAILVQILLNLLTNAKEACSRASDTVRIATMAPIDGEVAVLIADPGAGVPAGAGRPLVTTRTPGSHGGVGLFVARTLAQRVGGRLRGEPGGVRLVLPVIHGDRGKRDDGSGKREGEDRG